MAAFYELRYWKNFEQPDGSIVRLEIHSKGVEGISLTAYEIGPVVQALALTIQGQTDDIDAPIVKTSLNMTFLDAPDHPMSFLQKCGDWEEFYTSDSTYWKVLILGKKNASSASFTQLWGGYITPDSFSEELTYRGSVTLTARDNIGHMQDFPFDAEGDENGLISLRELVEAAWAKIESPMSLYWPALRWLQCNGVYAFDTRMNISAFKDMTWYDAVEKALYSYGAVMRYIGENQVLLCSLRYMPQQARPSIDQVTHIEPVFIANARRELVPAARRIEESVGYELVDSVTMPQVKEDDFTGSTQTYRCKIDGIDMGNGSFGTLEHDAPVWPIEVAFSGWSNPSNATLFFNPDAYDIGYFSERKGLAEDIYRYMYIACNNVDNRSVSFTKTITCSDISIRMKFGQPVSLDKNNKLEQQAVFNLKKISYSVKMIQGGITNYLAKDNRWVVGEQILVKEYDAKTQSFDFEQQVSMEEYSGSAEIVFTVYNIEYAQTSLANLAQYGLYACVQSLAFAVPESLSLLKKNTVNTKYQDSNNVILSREPELGPAYNTVALPGIIKNGIFYYEGNVVQPAKAWSWNDGTPQQMAVYNHLQLLCYHSKPNNLITGDIVNADVIKTAAIYVWDGAEHMLISGTYNYLTGHVEGAVLREFVRYDDMWGEISGNSLPDTETDSTTNQEGGGSTSPGSTNENTTNVVIGGEGGGSVTVDPFLSDTSTNPVESKAIKAYIDSADIEIKERIAALEEGGLGGNCGLFEFVYDTATNKATAEMVAALAEAIADNKLILCNGRTYKFILEQDGMYGLVSDAYLDIMTGELKVSVLAVMSTGEVQIQEQPIEVGTQITEATVAGWGFTKNAGTITGIKMNGASKGTSGVVDLGTVITAHQQLKTINNQSLVGSGNITIQGGGGATERVEMTAESAAIEPNKFYVWPMMDNLDVSLGAEQSGVMNRYLFQFRNPKAGVTLLTLPDDITWSEDTELDENGMPVMEAAAFYRIEIIEGLASLKKWKLVYINFADAGVERVLMAKGIGDGIGITKQDAAAVTSISNWFKNNTDITSFDELRFFKNITNLVGYWNDGAFQGCTNLHGLILPANMTVVGQSSFQGCTALEYLNIPQGVHDIPQTFCKGCSSLASLAVNWQLIVTVGSESFSGCAALVTEIISNSIKDIADWAFYNSRVRGTLHLPNLEKIGNRSFKNTDIEEVTSLGKITELGKYSTWNGAGYGTFAGCTALWRVVLHEGVALIGQSAFHGCTALEELNWVDSIETIEQEAFRDTPQMTIEISPSNNLKKIADWAFYNSGVSGDLYLPYLEEIKNRSFKNCKNLQSVSSLGKITELGKYESWNGNGYGVFAGCTSLMSVRDVSNVTLIGQSAFQGCTALKEDAFDWNKVTVVEQDAFADCTSWELEVVMTSLVTVSDGAFRNTPKTSIIIDCPNMTGTIGSRAFTSSGVTEVRNLGSITSIASYNNNAMYNGWSYSAKLKFFRLPATCVEIPPMAFRNCPLLDTFISESEVPPTAGTGLFDNTPCVIYVPDASVEAYKNAMNWNTYADRIKGISEYTG